MTRRFAVLAIIVVVLLLYFLIDPASGLLPECPFYKLTGLYCPGCGSQRAMHALLHGQIGRSLGLNPLLILSLVYALVEAVMLLRIKAGKNAKTVSSHKHVPLIVLGIVLAFWVLRNIPIWPFSLLAP